MANPAAAPARRVYHSASSDALGQRCERAWWYSYGPDKLREPDVAWSDADAVRFEGKPRKPRVLTAAVGRLWKAAIADLPIIEATLPSRAAAVERAILNFYLARAKALGGEVHGRLEAWYHGARLATHDKPGQIALSGLPHLPTPEECERGETECEIGDVPLPKDRRRPDAPKVAYEHGGILWAGKRDLIVQLSRREWRRLGLPSLRRGSADGRWLLTDYKTTGQIDDTAEREGFAKSPDELRADVQAGLYGLASCVELGLDRIAARWLYLETKDRRKVRPVDVVLDGERCEKIVDAATKRARRLNVLRSERDAEQNPDACADYGGCPYHVSAGGPCDAQQSFGKRISRALKRTGSKWR